MSIRTYYWDRLNMSRYSYYKMKLFGQNRPYFKYGNAGDMFNIDLIRKIYDKDAVNIKDEGNRLFLVGSVMNRVQEGDIINGIGWKGNDLKSKEKLLSTLKVYGVRGPLTRQLFERSGTDLSSLKFEYDPGLLIKEVYDIDLSQSSSEQIIFIPHFRDEVVYKKEYPKNITHVSIDANPKKIAKEILKSKVVYSSSLHGIIFSHALRRPCVFVRPQSNEGIFKYRDYYLSIGMDMPEPLKDIYAANFVLNKPTIMERNIGMEDFYFPSSDMLRSQGIIIN